jgi:hypothetical protein
MMTSKEIAEMIQRAKEAVKNVRDQVREDPYELINTEEISNALDELIAFTERPVYEHVKAEDCTEGYHWVVESDGSKTVVYLGIAAILRFLSSDSGVRLYRFPDLEVPE